MEQINCQVGQDLELLKIWHFIYRTVCTLIETVQGLSCSARESKLLFAIDVFFNLKNIDAI